MKLTWLFLLLFPLGLYWRNRAHYFENQSKNRLEQIQRLQFKIQNLQAKPGSLCFFGDSLTLLWPTHEYFPGSYNRGISSETTEKMFSRFEEDVVNLHPKIVVILGGTNDVATGIDSWKTKTYLKAMYQKAMRNNIHPYLGTIPPIAPIKDFPKRDELNKWIRQSGYSIIDFDESLISQSGAFLDRAHPSLIGYTCMSKLVKEAL